MPKRPSEHIISDRGVAEVVRILSDAEWACEQVSKDYGEDLICQTIHNEQIDSHRILVQVKTTEEGMPDVFKLSVDRTLLLKWISDTNLVIVCAVSLKDKITSYEIPSEVFSLFDVHNRSTSTVQIKISRSSILDVSSANQIAWMARLRNIDRQHTEITNIIDKLDYRDFENRKEFEKEKGALINEEMSVVIKFLCYIGLAEDAGKQVKIYYQAFIDEMIYLGSAINARRPDLKNLDLDLNATIALAVIMRATRTAKSRIGFPRHLIERSAKIFSTMLIDFLKTKVTVKGKPATDRYIRRTLLGLTRNLWKHGATLPMDTVISYIEDEIKAGKDRFRREKR